MNRKRLLSFVVVCLFCLLCLGTSRPRSGPVPLGAGGGLGLAPMSSAPKSIPHSAPERGRIDPFDPVLTETKSHYDAYVLNLVGGTGYRVTVAPDHGEPDAGAPPRSGAALPTPPASAAPAASPSDSPSAAPSAAPPPAPAPTPAPESAPRTAEDAGAAPLWFSVRVFHGDGLTGAAVAVHERTQDDGATLATFRAPHGGPYTVVVTAFFGVGEHARPGFSTYVLEVTPTATP